MPDTGVIYAATKLDRYVEEAFLSAHSVKRFAPNLSITLFTDRPAHPLCALGLFDRIETVASATGFGSAWAEGQLSRIDCLSRSPYSLTLQLDTDTRVQSTDLETVFEQLGTTEIAMVEEAADVSLSRAWTGRRMFNVGFILYRMTPGVLRCLDAWATRVRRNFGFALQTPLPFVEELAHVSDEDQRRALLRMDQVALMEILSPERNVFDLSCTQLGSAWNYRRSELAYCQPDQVKIAHSDAFKKTTHADILALAFDGATDDPKLSDKLYEYVASRQPSAGIKPRGLRLFRKAPAGPEEWPTKPHRNADLHLRYGQGDKALTLYGAILADNPGDPFAVMGHARVAARLGQADNAVELASHAVTMLPRSPYILMLYGYTLLGVGRAREAVTALDQALPAGDAACAYHLGGAHFSLEQYDAAAAAYRLALERDPEHPLAAHNLMPALLGSRQYAEALKVADTHLAARPWNVAALAFKSTALAELGETTRERALVDLALIACETSAAPLGYESIGEFNAALIEAILREPSVTYQPGQHATRGGWHSGDLSTSDAPPIQALNALVLATARRRVDSVPHNAAHPFHKARPLRWRLQSWAIIIEDGGFQIPHIHAAGWLSGVYYAEVPEAINAADSEQAGWLTFGRSEARWHRPDTRTVARQICPTPGLLVTFPSFFWHGTNPTKDCARRISFAFDIQPF